MNWELILILYHASHKLYHCFHTLYIIITSATEFQATVKPLQRAKNILSASLGLVGFIIHLPDGQVKISGGCRGTF